MAKVDWKTLNHARGAATRVPQQIKDLAKSGHPSDAASLQLAEALLVPGRWLETSEPAAELLVAQMTKKAAVPVPLELRLLGDLAAADHLWFATRGARDARANDERGGKTLAIAQKALPIARAWLADADAARRAFAVFFLALAEVDGASADLTIALAENDPRPEVRGGAWFALGFHARSGHAGARDALASSAGDGFALAGRWAGRVVAGIDPPSDETVEAVAAWFVRWEPPLLPWGRSQPLRIVTALTRALPASEELAPPLVRSAAKLGPARTETRLLCSVAIDLAGFTTSFGEREVVAAERLNSIQRATAEQLIALPGPLLGLRHGLPGSSRATARWLGLTTPGVLEREEGGLARWQRIRALFGDTSPSGAMVVAESLKGLSPAEQLEAARELLLGAYKIFIQVDARLAPSALAELASKAGPEAISWARETMGVACELQPRGTALGQLSPEHLMVALATLVDADQPIEPAWEAFLSFAPAAEARKVWSALEGSRRADIVLRRLALSASFEPVARAQLLDAIAPILDIVSSPAVVGAMREALAVPAVAQFTAPETARAIQST